MIQQLLEEHGQTLLPVVGATLLVWLLASSLRGRNLARKDPQRMFDAQQRAVGLQRAGQQCEFSTPWLTRCTRTAQHADHFFPHARGGASTMRNLVAACAPHNLSKGARLPSTFTRLQIQARRRRYFPAHQERTAGQWYS